MCASVGGEAWSEQWAHVLLLPPAPRSLRHPPVHGTQGTRGPPVACADATQFPCSLPHCPTRFTILILLLLATAALVLCHAVLRLFVRVLRRS